MADISDTQAIKFANEQIRPLADAMGASYKHMKTTLAFWDAKSVSSLFPNDASLVIDGSASDGRTPIVGADVNALITIVRSLVGAMEANNNAALNQVIKIAVNPG